MPSNEDVTRFTMRLPNDIYENVKELAESNKRSVAKQIEFIIDQYLLSISKGQSSQNR